LAIPAILEHTVGMGRQVVLVALAVTASACGNESTRPVLPVDDDATSM
jgi:hypothetical protein